MNIETGGRSRRGLGIFLMLALLAVGFIAAASMGDVRRYLKMRSM